MRFFFFLCVFALPLGAQRLEPDLHFVPGQHRIDPHTHKPVTKEVVCVSGYSSTVRNVPKSLADSVYERDGITHRKPGEYEVDHWWSLENGGENSLKNLWAQSYITKPYNAHVKDKLENQLHREICSGKITLSQAEKELNSGWIKAYNKRFGVLK